MVLRLYGIENLQKYIRNHIKLAEHFEALLCEDPRFEVNSYGTLLVLVLVCSCNNSSLVLFGLSLKVFKTHLLGRGFHILIKNASVSSPTDVRSHNPLPFGPSVFTGTHSLLQSMWDPPIHPLRGPTSLLPHRLVSPLRGSTSLLAHHPVFDSNTICNDPSLLLADIIFFGLSLSGFSSRFLKRICWGEVSIPL